MKRLFLDDPRRWAAAESDFNLWMNPKGSYQGDATFCVGPRNWPRFLDKYGVSRCFHGGAGDEVGLLAEKFATQSTDPVALANEWQNARLTNRLALSAASKALFFLRPDQPLMIFDRFAFVGLKALGQKLPQRIKTADQMECFMDAARRLRTEVPRLENICRQFPNLSEDFMARRLTDKYLFVVGCEETAIKAVDTLNDLLACNGGRPVTIV